MDDIKTNESEIKEQSLTNNRNMTDENFVNKAIDTFFPVEEEKKTETTNDVAKTETVQDKVETTVETKSEPVVTKETVDDLKVPDHWGQELKDRYNAKNESGKRDMLENVKELEKGYQRKYQEVANEKKKVEAYEKFIQKVESDPNFYIHIANYKPTEAENNFGMGQRPSDPYEALRYDNELSARKAADDQFNKREEERKQVEFMNAINNTKRESQNDPLFEQVFDGMKNYLESIDDDELREKTEHKLNWDVGYYKKIYLRERQKIVEKQGNSSKTSDSPTNALKNVVGMEKTPRAPVLEAGGAESEAVNTKQLSRRKANEELEKNGNPDKFVSFALKEIGF